MSLSLALNGFKLYFGFFVFTKQYIIDFFLDFLIL